MNNNPAANYLMGRTRKFKRHNIWTLVCFGSNTSTRMTLP